MSFNFKSEKVLANVFDNKNNFQCHIGNLCFNASKEIHALASIGPYMDPQR